MNIRIKQKWGLLFLLFVTAAYIIIFFAQNKKSSNDIVEIYFADRITAAHKVLIEKYNKIHEGKIKVIGIDFPNFDFSTNERKEMLARSLRGRGDGIDLFAVDIVWVQRFAKWCEPLDKYFSVAEKGRIVNSALQACYYDGELVAVPENRVQGILYYRDDLLRKSKNYEKIVKKIKNNITWPEFIELRKEFSSKNPFYIFPAAEYEGLICVFMEALLSLNKNYFEENGFNLNTPEANQALQLLVDLVNKYKTTPAVVTEFTEIPSFEYFIKNDGLFIWGWPVYDKDFKDEPFDSLKENHLRKAPVPYFQSGTPVSIFGGWNLMVSKFSNKKEAAVDFLKFMLSDQSQEIFYKESRYYPITKSFYENPEYLKKYPEIETLKKLLKTGVYRPAHEDYTKYSKIMSFYFKEAIQNKISVSKALAECTNSIRTDKLMVEEF
ncbi:MAG TPA: extracellular solute-binding protein [Ignavibacteriaceae bacterium]|nr:extracellular solute-binding protein [Ignavibacteriaceae bacterium]